MVLVFIQRFFAKAPNSALLQKTIVSWLNRQTEAAIAKKL
jgi:hypothetical protein